MNGNATGRLDISCTTDSVPSKIGEISGFSAYRMTPKVRFAPTASIANILAPKRSLRSISSSRSMRFKPIRNHFFVGKSVSSRKDYNLMPNAVKIHILHPVRALEPPWIHSVSIDLSKYLQTDSMKNIYFFRIYSFIIIDLVVNKK